MISRRLIRQIARYEIFADGDGWRCRYFDGENVIPLVARTSTRDQCFKAVQMLRNTLSAPLVLVR